MNGGDFALRCVFTTFDAVSLLLQFAIFTLIFQATAKKVPYTSAAMMWVLFSPISLFGGDTHYNLGAINDCFWYGIMYATLLSTRYEMNWVKLMALSVTALAFDPRLFAILTPVTVMQLECAKTNTDKSQSVT